MSYGFNRFMPLAWWWGYWGWCCWWRGWGSLRVMGRGSGGRYTIDSWKVKKKSNVTDKLWSMQSGGSIKLPFWTSWDTMATILSMMRNFWDVWERKWKFCKEITLCIWSNLALTLISMWDSSYGHKLNKWGKLSFKDTKKPEWIKKLLSCVKLKGIRKWMAGLILAKKRISRNYKKTNVNLICKSNFGSAKKTYFQKLINWSLLHDGSFIFK